MNRPNMDYGMSMPTREQIRSAFGSLSRAAEITGGDLPTLLFYLHNPDRIESAGEVARQPGEYAKSLFEDAITERVVAAFDGQAKKSPTIIAAADSAGVCRSVARRCLVAAGRWPRRAMR